jgi:type II secretory pathway pseudopilin PulG
MAAPASPDKEIARIDQRKKRIAFRFVAVEISLFLVVFVTVAIQSRGVIGAGVSGIMVASLLLFAFVPVFFTSRRYNTQEEKKQALLDSFQKEMRLYRTRQEELARDREATAAQRALWRGMSAGEASDFIWGLLDRHPSPQKIIEFLPSARSISSSDILRGSDEFSEAEGSAKQKFAAMNYLAAAFYLNELIKDNPQHDQIMRNITSNKKRRSEAERVIAAIMADLDLLEAQDTKQSA